MSRLEYVFELFEKDQQHRNQINSDHHHQKKHEQHSHILKFWNLLKPTNQSRCLEQVIHQLIIQFAIDFVSYIILSKTLKYRCVSYKAFLKS